MNCPECGTKLPTVRLPRSFRQVMWGGGTCSNCGTEINRKGVSIGFRMPKQGQTGVEIMLDFFAMAFVLVFCKPTIEIDGKLHKRDWGTHFFELQQGRHTVKIYFRYLFMSQCGANSIDFEVKEGQTCRVKYYMFPWIFMKGSLKLI